MIKYRPHRGSLSDSLALTVEFDTIEQMKDYILSVWNKDHNILFNKSDIVIDKTKTFDSRCDWNTQRVCIKRCGAEKYTTPQCIGMCDLGGD